MSHPHKQSRLKCHHQSEAAAERSHAINKAFSPKQLTTLDQCGVDQMWSWTIARIQDEGKRNAIVNLIASGLDPQEAIARIEKTPEVRRADGLVYKVDSPSDPETKSETQMIDRAPKRREQSGTSLLAKERRITAEVKARFKVGLAFNLEQAEIIYGFRVGASMAAVIAGIRDERQRGAIVSLIGLGLAPQDAMARVFDIVDRREGLSLDTPDRL